MRKKNPLAKALVGGIALLALLTSCATAEPTQSNEVVGSSIPATVQPTGDQLESLAFLNLSELINFVPMTTTALGATSNAVIEGTLLRWVRGAQLHEAESGALVAGSLLAEIRIDAVERADSETLREGDVIYVTQMSGALTSEQAAQLPANFEVVAYLDGPLVRDELKLSEVYRQTPGDVPEGVTELWMFGGPQGLIIEVPGEDAVMWPMLGSKEIGTLADALPGGALDGLDDDLRRTAHEWEQQMNDLGVELETFKSKY